MAKGPKRSVVTDEHREEARLLREIWETKKEFLREQGYGSQKAFGLKFDIGNQAAVSFFLNGDTALSLKAAARFAKGLGCSVGDFSPRLDAMIRSLGGLSRLSPDVQELISSAADEDVARLEGVIRAVLAPDPIDEPQATPRLVSSTGAEAPAPPPSSPGVRFKVEGGYKLPPSMAAKAANAQKQGGGKVGKK